VLHVRAAAPAVFRRPRLPTGPVRGTGCALAAAIAASLAAGADVRTAVGRAGDWLHALLAVLGPAPTDGLPRELPFARAID
jgi:hydroxymethylpyrimidine/phosphomethylpyrimidine kinase